jgi:hypothetical protein
MVIDGSVEFVGNDARRATAEIAQAARRDRVAVQLKRTPAGLEIETGAAPKSADVWLAMADDQAASQVTSGENRGKYLRHVAILRALKKVGSVRRGASFRETVPLGDEATGKRLIVFLQDSDLGRVSGAGLVVP